MIKKLAATTIMIIIVVCIAMTSSADCIVDSSGIIYGYDGASAYERYYVTVTTTFTDYNVTLVTVKNGVIYNERTVLVYAGSSAIIYSYPSYYPGNYTYYVTYEIAE